MWAAFVTPKDKKPIMERLDRFCNLLRPFDRFSFPLSPPPALRTSLCLLFVEDAKCTAVRRCPLRVEIQDHRELAPVMVGVVSVALVARAGLGIDSYHRTLPAQTDTP